LIVDGAGEAVPVTTVPVGAGDRRCRSVPVTDGKFTVVMYW